MKKVYVEITNVCNLNCDFCPKTARKPQFLSLDELEQIFSKISGFSNNVFFHVMGEPLLHPSLDKFLDLAYEKGMNVNITTNGTLLGDEKVVDALVNAKSLKKINISLHSFDANKENIFKHDYYKNIFEFLDIVEEKTKIQVSLRLWDINNNKDKKNKQELLRRLEERYNLNFSIVEELNNTKGLKLKDRTYLNQAEKFEWPSLECDIISDSGFCYGLRNQIAILVNGDVVPCCLDGQGIMVLGNIFDNSLEDIIKSDRAKKIYNGFSKRVAVEEMCKRCGYKERFSKK